MGRLAGMELAGHLGQRGLFLPLAHMVAELAAGTLDITGNQLMIREERLILADTLPVAALALSVSSGAQVDPILLTQRTYNR